MNILKYKNYYFAFSGLLIAASIISMAVFGFRSGIDFSGGTLWQIKFQSKSASIGALQEILRKENFENPLIRNGSTDNEFFISLKEITEEKHQQLGRQFGEQLGEFEELSFASIGPAVGKELRNKAVTAFLMVLSGISLYVAFAFRKVSYPVSSWLYGWVTLVTLFHDVLIPAGTLSFLGWWLGVEADINFLVALLVIMGFSVHDTIVVFDRIRENLMNSKNKEKLEEIVNDSVNQTMARSINTSLTLVIVLVSIYLLGAESLKHFTLLILVGTITGAYSSIFIASPLLTLSKRK
ncbi:MAG: protein-export membrane protein SecF [Candidatus Harrisonbacteria bacterium RIFCSPLOWO2_02_FULL_41_11]|uniref:Protein-export membrane protein SecF n=1 Tax=Candidatus Harrisonbacteria bacterium RIFCSPHIGHO2_02_FULL_42_16 TaxID=1798404 RepID=A0A1G1ZF90_9BACT|nr:MAG: protein-export membrane protein SecF [Candidatus Harrisonbacteria bacterium RIFCSPHIGHO2_02_FULL_42_16]OGY66723.1 MAG: protein-export membrane protein SecF [Candidatus Harrisonbacteria bacterium RIFCSPLOWO2_02_FULL_41_11]